MFEPDLRVKKKRRLKLLKCKLIATRKTGKMLLYSKKWLSKISICSMMLQSIMHKMKIMDSK